MQSDSKLITHKEKAWWQICLKRPEHQGNLMQCSHATMSSNLLTRQVLGNLFLMETRIMCLIKQGPNLWSRNIKWDLLTVVLKNFSNKLVLKDWHYRTHNADLLNFDENKFDYKKNCLWQRKFAEIIKSDECTKCEKWRELKNYESTISQCKNSQKVLRQYKGSLHNFRNCKIRWILWVTQENFRKRNQIIVEGCLTFPVNLQCFRVLVPCLAATQDCRLIHAIDLDCRKTFLVINFPRLIQSWVILKSIWWRAKNPSRSYWTRKDEFHSHEWRQTKSRHNSNADILQQSQWLWVLQFRWMYRRTAWSDTNSMIDSHFRFGKFSFFNRSNCLFWFSIGSYVVDQGSGDGWFCGRVTSLRSVCGENFPNFEMLDAKNCFCSEQDHSEFPVQEEGQSRATESPERGPVSTRKTDRFHDLRPLSIWVAGAHDTVLDYADLFSVRLHDDSVQDFGTRWDELLPCQRFHPMKSWKVFTNWGYVSLCKSKLYWNCTTWRFIRRYRCPIIKTCMTMVTRRKDQKAPNTITLMPGTRKIEMGAVVTSRKGLSGIGWRERNSFVSCGKK